MIQVNIVSKNNQIQSFTLSGHAESGPYGHDLVCSAVSAIVFGSINAVLSLTKVDLSIDKKDKGGYIKVTIPFIKDKTTIEKVNLLFQGMIVSLETVERDYSKYIKISKQKK